jgi:hypothetical protein
MVYCSLYWAPWVLLQYDVLGKLQTPVLDFGACFISKIGFYRSESTARPSYPFAAEQTPWTRSGFYRLKPWADE